MWFVVVAGWRPYTNTAICTDAAQILWVLVAPPVRDMSCADAADRAGLKVACQRASGAPTKRLSGDLQL